jgi:hypothetical protein
MIGQRLKGFLVPFLHPDLLGNYVLSAIVSIIAGLAFAFGYGCVVRMGGFLFLFFLPTLLVSWLLVIIGGSLQRWWWRRLNQSVASGNSLSFADVVVYSFFAMAFTLSASIWIGAEVRESKARRMCRRVEPLLATLREEKDRTGSYPSNLRAFVKTNVPWRREVLFYFGETNGVEWLARHVGNSDVTLLAISNRLECVVPIERMSPVSFSSFQVFSFTSDSPRWNKTRLHWSLAGAYVDPPKE